MGSLVNSITHLEEKINTNSPTELVRKIQEAHLPIHFMRATLLLYKRKKKENAITRERKHYRPISLVNIDLKPTNEILDI